MTLDADNLHWLQGQTRAARTRSLSETLDRIVAEARRGGRVHENAIRSVVGTIEIHPDDPQLVRADEAVRALFGASITRPVTANRRTAVSRRRRGASRRG